MDNRQLIMEKALELFCARGYDAVGVQEIAEQSGITKPTLYYYFGSKQGLMETILEENSRILEEMLEKARRSFRATDGSRGESYRGTGRRA